MDLDIIICVHNAYEETKACIESVLYQNIEYINKIILVDDYSQTETKELLRDYNKKYDKIFLLETKEQQGYTKSANLGLKNSTSEVKTLLNSDTLVPSNWAVKIKNFFQEHKEIAIMGPFSNAASYQSLPNIKGTSSQTAVNDLPQDVTVEIMNKYLEEINHEEKFIYVPLVHGFCFSVTQECLNTIGYFDEESFPRGYGEENDFCVRAVDAGFGLGIDLRTYVYHEKSKSYQSEDRIRYMQNGWNALVKKHKKRRLVSAVEHLEKQVILQNIRTQVKYKFYEKKITVKPICFYLPQFHPTEINNECWGEGFTEWSNVTKAKPRFEGHDQPKLPTKFGFYDLRLPLIMQQQSDYAKKNGIHAFCFYYYRFAEKRVLNLPSDNYESLSDVIPFCYCWANESWTRAWDGASGVSILEQKYDTVTFNGLVDDLSSSVMKEHYLTSNGDPIFIIYQVSKIPNYKTWIKDLKEAIYKKTKKHLIVAGVYTVDTTDDIVESIDFLVQFPPHRIPRKYKRKVLNSKEIAPFEPQREDYFESYDDVIDATLDGHNKYKKTMLGLCPDWDNSPRREKNAHIIIGSTPEKFSNWLQQAIKITKEKYTKEEIIEPFIFINAWNEWAEGAVLEPSLHNSETYIQKVKENIRQ